MSFWGLKACGQDHLVFVLAVAFGVGVAAFYCGSDQFLGHVQAAPARKPAGPSGQATGKPVDMSGPYNAYLARLRGKVQANWDYPPGRFHVVLVAVVNADGSVGELTAKSSPPSDAAERAASAAFTQAEPLEPLPARSTPSVKVTMNFDSTYDPHGDSKSSLSGRLDPISPPRLQPAGSSGEPAAEAGGKASP